MEQEADAYLGRARTELAQAEHARRSPADAARLLAVARRDFERANNLYEPIAGFSNVSLNLESLNKDRTREEQLQQAYEAALQKRSRTRRWR